MKKTREEALAGLDAGDYLGAAEILIPLADAGDAQAQYALAQMYRFGNGVEQDAARCYHLYKLAAERGEPKACFALSMLLAPGATSHPQPMQSVPKDAAESKRYGALAAMEFKERAESGDAEACQCLGNVYEFGVGVDPDYEQAIPWYTKAFNAGRLFVANNLTVIYSEGDIRVRDQSKARLWYAIAQASHCRRVVFPEFDPPTDNSGDWLLFRINQAADK